jgi:hypothetical protein
MEKIKDEVLVTELKAAILFAIVVLCAILAVTIMVFVFAVKVNNAIEKDGVKSVVENVWCGSNKQGNK